LKKFSPIHGVETLGLVLKKRDRGYSNRAVIAILLIATMLARSIESTVEFLSALNAKEKMSADNILRLIKSMTLRTIESIVNNMLRKMVRPNFWRGRGVTIALDLTDELYWGEKTKYTKATKPRNGTSRAFKFLVGSIVSKYGKFIVYIKLIPENSDLVSEVKKAILHIEKVVKIGLILMDRGFASVKMIKMLLGLKYRFIMPLRMTKRLKKIAEKIEKSTVFRLKMVSKKYGSVSFWAVARVDDKKKPVFYAVLDKSMVRKPSDIHYAYSGRRWRIEINNKMVKLYKAKTSSPDPKVRYFLFSFACIIYNMWLLSSFNMVKTAKKKLNTPLHYKYYSVWTILVAFHATLSLL